MAHRQDIHSRHTSVQYSLITARTAHLRSMGYLTTVCVDRTPTNTAHLCSTVCSQARNAHTTRLAQELHCHLCAPEKNLIIWCVPCLILGCLTCRAPRAHHLPHSLFLLPRHRNTPCNRDNTIMSETNQCITHISGLPQSTSCALQNHSGVKTCRVAETRAQQLPQVIFERISS